MLIVYSYKMIELKIIKISKKNINSLLNNYECIQHYLKCLYHASHPAALKEHEGFAYVKHFIRLFGREN
ncbi:hypothetical protein BFP97_09800 [Roseivirga sp. 4D4]|nr:hypothetical protein BFP97_09800 [Roseivirga sp. 4D4]